MAEDAPHNEVGRLGRIRNIIPRSVIAPGYTLRLFWEGGEGHARVRTVTPHPEGGFTIVCDPWEPGDD